MKFAMSGFVAGKGFSSIEYTHPVVSAAQANDVDVLLAGIEYDVEFENTDNKAISLNQKITDHGNWKTEYEDVIYKEYNKDKTVKTVTKVFTLPFCPHTGEQLYGHNQNWQGSDYKSKPDDSAWFIRGRFTPMPYTEKGPDGTVFEGNRFGMIWEIAVVGKDMNGLDLTPATKVIVSQMTKMQRLKALCAAGTQP